MIRNLNKYKTPNEVDGLAGCTPHMNKIDISKFKKSIN